MGRTIFYFALAAFLFAIAQIQMFSELGRLETHFPIASGPPVEADLSGRFDSALILRASPQARNDAGAAKASADIPGGTKPSIGCLQTRQNRRISDFPGLPAKCTPAFPFMEAPW